MIEQKYNLIMLYDFYAKLLTDNQRNVLDMYLNYDMSLREIAERLDNSRQAVYDSIKRSEKKLKTYEKKLKLVKKFNDIKEKTHKFEEIIKIIQKNNSCKKVDTEINKLEDIVKQIIDKY